MEKTILNFHFDYLTPRLIWNSFFCVQEWIEEDITDQSNVHKYPPKKDIVESALHWLQISFYFIFYLLSVWATWVCKTAAIHSFTDKCQGSFQLLHFYNTWVLPRGWDLPWAIYVWLLIFNEEERVKGSSNVTVNGRLAKMTYLYYQFTSILWGTNFYPVHLDK